MDRSRLFPPLAALVCWLVSLAFAAQALPGVHGYSTKANILYRAKGESTDYEYLPALGTRNLGRRFGPFVGHLAHTGRGTAPTRPLQGVVEAAG